MRKIKKCNVIFKWHNSSNNAPKSHGPLPKFCLWIRGQAPAGHVPLLTPERGDRSPESDSIVHHKSSIRQVRPLAWPKASAQSRPEKPQLLLLQLKGVPNTQNKIGYPQQHEADCVHSGPHAPHASPEPSSEPEPSWVTASSASPEPSSKPDPKNAPLGNTCPDWGTSFMCH